MKYARCENPDCKREAPLSGPMETVPHGWIDATEHDDKKPNTDFLACSRECMVKILLYGSDLEDAHDA